MIHLQAKSPSAAKIPEDETAKWEVRPCGMLVQKRSSDDDPAAEPVPAIRLRVKYGSNYHDVYINSQATFGKLMSIVLHSWGFKKIRSFFRAMSKIWLAETGELRKLLAERTGLHPQDQKILFKNKERDSAAYLDTSGVKNRSKLVVVEDAAAQAKRLLEMRRAAKFEKAVKSVSQISLEIDKLAAQVSALEGAISKGRKVAENDVLRLTEQLMNELIKLDGIIADGDIKLQSRIQVKRVQKYVETLDALKLKNAIPKSAVVPTQHQHPKKPFPSSPPSKSVIVTTKWETFDSLFPPLASASSPGTTAAAPSSASPTPRFDWELF